MGFIDRINRLWSEQTEQVAIAQKQLGGCKFRYHLDMLWCLARYGARPIDYIRFEFHRKSAKERDRYMTIHRFFKICKKLGIVLGQGIYGNKANEYRAFEKFIKREWIEVDANTPIDDIQSFLKKHHVVIAKPNMGEQGHGVMKIQDDNTEAINELLNERKKTSFVVEECLRNADAIGCINPSSLNTIRATTFIDKQGHLHILSIILRVGAPGAHVDNWGAGGVGYNFDVKTGVCNCLGLDKKNKKYSNHPGSEVKMIGFELPNFEALLEYIKSLTTVIPSARYVGWDIAITPNGFDLVEMNSPAGHDMFQSFDNPVYHLLNNNV